MKLQTEIFEKFDKGWPILTAGDKLCSWADIMGV